MDSNDEIMTFYGRCRCCLEHGYMKSMWKEYIWDNEREIYGEMLLETFNITWESNDTEEHICETCVSRLRDAFHFKKEVLSAEQLLEEGFDEGEHLDNETEDEYLEKISLKIRGDNESQEELDLLDVEVKTEYEIEYLEEDAEIVEQSVHKIEKDTDSDSVSNSKWPRKKKHERSSYRNYTQADLKNCIEMIQSKGISQLKASKIFKIPTKTVNAKMSSLRTRADEGSDSEDESHTREIAKHRTNIQTILKYTNATPIRGHQGIGYMCRYCPKQYAKAAELKKHTYTHRNIGKYNIRILHSYSTKLDITGLICKVCREDIDDLSLGEVMEHLRAHGKAIHTDIKNHILPFKLKNEELNCVLCSKKFSYFKLLAAHMSEHYSNYKCKQCGKGFVNKHSRQTHTYRHNVGQYPCSRCEKIFPTRSRVRDHERVVHIWKNKTQKCSYCFEKFIDVVHKRNHEVAVHGAAPPQYLCPGCDKVFDSQRSVTSHFKRCHLKLRPHKCEFCVKSFFKKSALQKHLVTHTGEKNYQCDVCKRCYGTRGNLKTHFKTHGEFYEDIPIGNKMKESTH